MKSSDEKDLKNHLAILPAVISAGFRANLRLWTSFASSFAEITTPEIYLQTTEVPKIRLIMLIKQQEKKEPKT